MLRLFHACPFCTIAPPHILREIASRGDAQEREAAERTLEVTRALRTARLRAIATGAPPPAAETEALFRRRTGARSTHDAGNMTRLPGRLVRDEASSDSGDTAVDEAHVYAGITRDFLQKVFRRRSLDGRGMPLVSTVHYDRDYENAFWDGGQMVYGDGDGRVFQRFTVCLDVVGHELAHGVTQFTSNLVYFEQPGALNEHFSDVIGSLVKQWHRGEDAAAADWLIGAGLLAPGIRGRALRSMSAPGTAYDDPLIGRDPQPAHMRDFHHGPEDQGGVHINSGIPNRVFWRVATEIGGPAWELPGRIWWQAFTGMLRARADFGDAARATADAAGELGGRGAAATVLAAWREAGVVVPRARAGATRGAARGAARGPAVVAAAAAAPRGRGKAPVRKTASGDAGGKRAPAKKAAGRTAAPKKAAGRGAAAKKAAGRGAAAKKAAGHGAAAKKAGGGRRAPAKIRAASGARAARRPSGNGRAAPPRT